MVSASPEPPSVIPAEWPAGATAGASSERKHPTELASDFIPNRTPVAMRSARRWHTITPEINTDDNILRSLCSLCSLHSLRSLFRSLHSLHSLVHSLHRSKE